MKKTIKRTFLIAGTVLMFLVMVLCVHIYLVTRSKAPDASTRVMARVDFKQQISNADATKISTWLSMQTGVDRVMYNAGSNSVVFTYAPIQADGNKIVSKMKSSLHYDAVRYMPSTAEMQKGCPVSETSTSYKLYSFIKNII